MPLTKNHYKSSSFLLGVLLLLGYLLWPQMIKAVTQGYKTDEQLSPGMVVSLVVNSEDKVEKASPDNVNRVIGIVVQPSESLVTLGSSDSQVFVESSDQAAGYVTDLGGRVQAGDNLTVSPLKGLLMKASPGQRIIATALQDFTDEGEEVTVKDENGTERAVKLLKLRVSLSSGGKSQVADTRQSSLSALEAFAEGVVDRDVTSFQVVTALVIFVIMLVGEGTVLYGAVTSSIISLGRNPMAKKLIRRELLRTVAIAVVVLLVGMGSIYAVLWA